MLPNMAEAQVRHVNADLIELGGPTKTRLLTGGGVDTVVLELPSHSGTLAAHPMAIAATTGTVVQYAAEPVPSGYVLSRGQNVSRAQYSALYDLIGTTYGAGNGTTTFTLPNLSSIPTDGLVGWWPFNGNANDESGGGSEGTIYGASLVVDRFGYTSSAYQFDGNDWIEMADQPRFNTVAGTVSIWFKSNVAKDHQLIYKTAKNTAQSEHYAIGWYEYLDRMEGDVKFNSLCKPGRGWIKAFTTNAYLDYKWHHVMMTWGDGAVRVYVDGLFVAQKASPVNNADICAGGPIIIGGGWAAPVGNFVGCIDDIAIYNRILTPAERSLLFAAESPRLTSVIKY
jgi:hypothetical protein